MTNPNSLRVVTENLDVVLIMVAAYAIAAWVVFKFMNEVMVDDLDWLGRVNVRDIHRLREIDEIERHAHD